MSGHCYNCGTYHEEDDSRLCGKCIRRPTPHAKTAEDVALYIKRPIPVPAVQFDPVGVHRINLPVGVRGIHSPGADNWAYEGCDFFIDTTEGAMRVVAGDWVCTGVNGEHWATKPDVFAKTYISQAEHDAAIAAAIREEYERGVTIGFDRGQGLAKTREGAMARAGLVFDGEDKIVTRSGHILDDAGNVRRVEGHGLAISADGVVLTPGARAWRLDDTDPIDGEPFEGWVVLSVDRGECETQRFRWVTISGIGEATAHSLYSTLAAALHAKDAHAGEKGAAHEG